VAAEWQVVTVGDIADSISETHPLGKDKLIFLNTSDILLGKILHRSYTPVEAWPGQAKKSIQKDDILFSEIRPANGRYAYVVTDADDYVVSTKLMVIRVKDGRVLPKFLYHFLTCKGITGWLQHLAESRSGTFPQITFDQIAELELSLPPMTDQAVIATFLDEIDSKIELNRRMNETLEAMARAIFKSWFVDFDPVRAKTEGRQPFGMDSATAALFPDSFEDSLLGKIPKGWSLTTLGQAIEIYDSKRIPLSGRERIKVKGTYPYYGAAGVLDHVNSYLFDGVYILIGEDGSVVNEDDTPVVQYVWGRFWVNNHAHVLQGYSGISNEHLLLFLQTINIRPYVTGAVQPKLNQGNLCRIPFLMPDKEVCDAFGDTVESLYDLLRANTEQSRTLTTIRDALLPKIISGEIRVRDATKLAEVQA